MLLKYWYVSSQLLPVARLIDLIAQSFSNKPKALLL
uniref:Uncharacterized protein n=1 Tax=Siphoviridae sp. ctt8434 TaxID=2825703 RepID=A0A8S5U1J5_9CAUD|nr:MAG TPA: hypothetical protein [Siphoviridae sp. ctt8434]